MAAESATSSWHPALMPNAEPPPSSSVANTDDDHTVTELPEQPVVADPSTISTEANKPAPEETSNVDAWFHDEEAGEGENDDWLAENQPEPKVPSAKSDILDAPTADQTPEETQTSKSSSSGAQHGSSMSFARTVSHDINFHDDDEGDWDLTRTDTDPFKFMPPSDRTNSFPVVPPQTTEQNVVEQPLSSTQATAILEEDDEEASAHGPFAAELQPSRGPSGSIGGQIPDFEAQVSDERYEEGLPLLSQDSEEIVHPNEPEGAHQVAPFDDDDGGDDDFFGSVSQAKASEVAEEVPQPLERKSTIQVMGGALGGAEASQTSATQESLQEEEDDASTPVVDSNTVEDVDAKWQAAFGGGDDDDDFLLEDTATGDDQIDPAAFLGSDDEGLLDELEEDVTAQPQPSATTGATNPYMPQGTATQRSASAYTPSSNLTPNPAASSAFYKPPPAAAPFGAAQQPQPAPAEPSRMQSFADKAKGGYASPYDLPTDLVSSKIKPRKRASMQHMAESAATPPPPPGGVRSASMFAPGPPASTLSPPTSSHGPPTAQKVAAPTLRNKSSFFEELPMQPKPRPSSRQNSVGPGPPTPQSVGQSPPTGYGQMAPPLPPSSNPYAAPQQQAPTTTQEPSVIGGLVAPEKTSPYAGLQSAAPIMPAVSTNSARYSPAPPQQPSSSVPPAAASARYSPAPSIPRSQSSYSVAPGPQTPTGPPMLPHQPRTSSPLAHFEINRTKSQGDVTASNAEPGLPERRASASAYEPRLNRIASLPPTREVEEEEDKPATRAVSASQTSPPSARQRYSPAPATAAAGMMSPPAAPSSQQTLPPPSRATSNYMPQASVAGQAGFVPPPRAQTGSPSAAYGATSQAGASGGRPASAHAQTVPIPSKAPQTVYAPATRPRGRTMEFNMVPPNDSRAQDPLQRWKGAALLTWGVGGTVVTCFPKSIPRYGMNQTTPSIIRSHGEVKVRTIKDIDPLQDRLAKFPGPLRGKSKKKETLAWLSAGIESIEKDLPDVSFNSELSLEAKRSIERLLLWKILRVFIENDGVLEGSASVDKAVRDILAPETMTPTSNNDALFPTASGYGPQSGAVTAMSSDGVDSSTMEQIRRDLLKGDRESAVWAAVDKRLWGHAMLISQTVSPDLYKRVAQEFVRKEVNYPGHQNESLGALYKILSGNHDDCVDELVPSHARAGLQLVSTAAASNATGPTADGLDKWRETLSLVLGNRSQDDNKGLKALGNLLASYGRAEAAHICYLFSRSVSVFGGLDDPNADFVLLGSDHRRQSDQFAKETEALELSEVYEYGLTLAGTIAASSGAPHLAAYKLQHAITLAEYGFRDRALQYCEAIAAAMTAQTRRSAYHHAVLEGAVDDFMRRLKQAPKGESGSWMSKPSMNKLSGSLLSKFNTFVSGDEGDGSGNGGEGETGHFARIATTPNMSRSPSVSNFEMYGSSPGVPSGLMSPPMGAAASKYAPMGASTLSTSPYDPSPYAPVQSTTVERQSGEHSRGGYVPSYPGADAASQSTGYAPLAASDPSSNYQPTAAGPSYGGYQPHPPETTEQPSTTSHLNGGTDAASAQADQGYEPPSYGYQAPDMSNSALETQESTDALQQSSSGYEPPSYGYQAPSYEPEVPTEAVDDDEPKPKKKSFMDDDEDDIPALRPAAQKSRAEIDKENEEMFRKAAEEDAKRAAAQQAQKKGWGFGGWFGGKKADAAPAGEANPNKPVRAKLGESSSFVYDPDLKRWINKKPGAENVEAKGATPPPPKGGPRSAAGTPPPPSSTGTPPPPMSTSMPPPRSVPTLEKSPSMDSVGGAPPMARSASNTSMTGPLGGPPSRPPSRPTTSISNASSIDDLLGAAAPRKPGQKKPRKSGRYVDVMAK
ncbi:sec23-binding domain of sec16 domain-containing protein [Sarocladium implicatum]|nr:sec23-binding domain of sec16 domain-containing protein [Sarocladium implicatum]